VKGPHSSYPPEALFPTGALTPPLRIIDVRAPIEVSRGAVPHAVSLPLMLDHERHQVGIRYAEAGQEAAVELGWRLVGPHLPERVEAWRAHAGTAPTAVMCWRGGLRSAIASELIDRVNVRPVAGGYKALRRHLMQALEPALERSELVVLSGLTGSGKTALLQRLRTSSAALTCVDIEALARHRGSSFGATDDAQPAQASFELALASELILQAGSVVLVEDESRYVGRRTLPDALLRAMQRAPLALLEAPLEARVDRVFDEYVRDAAVRRGVAAAHADLVAGVLRLRRRLGHQRVQLVTAALDAARADWLNRDAHSGWVRLLLEQYYDRLYDRNRTALGRTVIAQGDAEVLAEVLIARAEAKRGERP